MIPVHPRPLAPTRVPPLLRHGLLAVSALALVGSLAVPAILFSTYLFSVEGYCNPWGIPRAPDHLSVPPHHVNPPCDGFASLMWGMTLLFLVTAAAALALWMRLRPDRGARPVLSTVGALTTVAAAALACGPMVYLRPVPGFRRLCGNALFGVADTCPHQVGPLWWALVAAVAAVAAWAWFHGRPRPT
ncbi:hypothetical protein [Nocardiopsis sp. CC223A]|uniref:hypothetical protein n=1 Tax=Nocardiopsis sp. CC223A TaxID=3044051 RepID=UPI00278C16EF|nr:hypothetical protein [Nocardiopsis sp. CC223A]